MSELCKRCGYDDLIDHNDDCGVIYCQKCGFNNREEQLQNENAKLVGALKWYASVSNWISFGHYKKERITKADCEILDSISGNGFEIDYQFSCGGKLARQILKDLGIEI